MPTFKIVIPSTRSASGQEMMRWTVPKSITQVTYQMLTNKLRDLIAVPTSGYTVTWTDEEVTHSVCNTQDLQTAIAYYAEKTYADRCVRLKAEPQDEIDLLTALDLLAAEEKLETPAIETVQVSNQNVNRHRPNLTIHHNPPVDIQPEAEFNHLHEFNSEDASGTLEQRRDQKSLEKVRDLSPPPNITVAPRGTGLSTMLSTTVDIEKHLITPFKQQKIVTSNFQRRTPSPTGNYSPIRRTPSPLAPTRSKFNITIIHSGSDNEMPVHHTFEENANLSDRHWNAPCIMKCFPRHTPSPPVQDLPCRKSPSPPPIPVRAGARKTMASSTPDVNTTSLMPTPNVPFETDSPSSNPEPVEVSSEQSRPLKVSEVCRKIALMGYDVPEQKLRRIVKECKGNINEVLDQLNTSM